MSNNALITFIVIILSIVIVDIFCGEVVSPKGSSFQSSTPWPSLGQRWTQVTPKSNQNQRPAQGTAPKWIQQNNIWIRNEQEASILNNRATVSSTTVKTTTQSSTVKISGTIGNQSHQKGALNNGASMTNPVTPTNTNQNKPKLSYSGIGRQNSGKNPPTPSPPNGSGVVGQNSPSTAVPNLTGQSKPNVSPAGPDKQDRDGQDAAVSNSAATDDELREFSEALLKKDVNNAGKYVVANFQGMTTSRSTRDEAPQPLLVVDQAAYDIPSVEKMTLLFNNYILEANQNEVYTAQERIEENNLLDTVLATPVMQYARSFLIQKGKIGKDPREFKDLLRLIWFNMYSRGGGKIGSSGFEHVFLAELKNNMVSGLHNWLYFAEEEKKNRTNYLGYMKKIDLGNKGSILKYHFTFHGVDKPVGSMFIGTSPELEMALYSVCFLLRADGVCPLKMNNNRFIIRTFNYRYRSKNMIGSAFPEI